VNTVIKDSEYTEQVNDCHILHNDYVELVLIITNAVPVAAFPLSLAVQRQDKTHLIAHNVLNSNVASLLRHATV
jgi:hypothetical protein